MTQTEPTTKPATRQQARRPQRHRRPQPLRQRTIRLRLRCTVPEYRHQAIHRKSAIHRR